MKKKDKQALREKTTEELKTLLKEKRNELFELRLDKSQHKLKNTKLLFWARKEIALILTLIREKELLEGLKKGGKET